MTTRLRRRIAALRGDAERGSLSMALLLIMMFAMLSVTLVTSTVTLNAGARAADLRTHTQQLLASMRAQLVGGMNSRAVDYTNTHTVSGCTSGAVDGIVLPTTACAAVTFAAATADDATSTGNLKLTVSLEAWQHMANATAKLADTKTSFQAYGTCVVGYVAGTGTATTQVQYSPCSATTPAAAKHYVWVGRDSSPAPAPTGTPSTSPSPSPSSTSPSPSPTTSAPAPPPAPAALTLAPVQGRSGELLASWTASPTATSYRVLYAVTSTVPDTAPSVTTTGTSTAVGGLGANQTVYVKIIPVNAGGSGAASSTTSAMTTPPPVTSVTFTPPSSKGPGTATWGAATGAVGYRVVELPTGTCATATPSTTATPTTTGTTFPVQSSSTTTVCVFPTNRSSGSYYYGTPGSS